MGTAVGDALGLCCEGLSRRRGGRMYPDLERYQLFGGRGLGSDDTDHALITAWALEQARDLGHFRALLRRGLRRWFLSLPAGIGMATLRSGVRLTLGLSKTGVASAGNGPVMRAPVLGCWAVDHDLDLAAWVRACTEVTHTDERAVEASLLVAQATRRLCLDLPLSADMTTDPFLSDCLADILSHSQEETLDYCARKGWGKGVTGFVYQTVPVVLQACLRHRDDYAGAVRSVIQCGGDTDTTAAIVGGMLGARLGKSAIPQTWLEQHRDWPVSLNWLETEPLRLPAYPRWLARNLVFFPAILAYGFRRLLPPW